MVATDARTLILGSFPSERSLETGEYYANRRNQFWRLLGATFGFDADAPYPERVAAAGAHGVALWDVVHSCRRAGSMDHAIDRASVTANDVAELLDAHPGIDRIFVNGLTAATLYEALVTGAPAAVRLPSSSGAMAIPFEDKVMHWRAVR